MTAQNEATVPAGPMLVDAARIRWLEVRDVLIRERNYSRALRDRGGPPDITSVYADTAAKLRALLSVLRLHYPHSLPGRVVCLACPAVDAWPCPTFHALAMEVSAW